MTDNFGPLRRAMSDLAEHGGSTDMYERSVRRSRQTQRRTAIATGAAATVLAIGGTVAFATAASRPSPPPPATTPSVTPASVSPSPSSVPASSAPPSSTRAGNRPRNPECPSAKTLERLADLPQDWYFVPSSVECWKNWATADPEGPTPGDGIVLFHYKPGTGWRYHSEGSGFQCQDLGITAGKPPFCYME